MRCTLNDCLSYGFEPLGLGQQECLEYLIFEIAKSSRTVNLYENLGTKEKIGLKCSIGRGRHGAG